MYASHAFDSYRHTGRAYYRVFSEAHRGRIRRDVHREEIRKRMLIEALVTRTILMKFTLPKELQRYFEFRARAGGER